MANAKPESQLIKNLELLKTYYSSEEPAQDKKIHIIGNKRRFPLLVLLSASFLAGGSFLGYYLAHHKPAFEADRFDVTRVIPKRSVGYLPYNNVLNFDYSLIKEAASPIILRRDARVAAINMKETVNVSGATISFLARGTEGTEKIAVILKDDNNISNANKEDLILTSSLSADKWRMFNIDVDSLYLPINKNRISQIRLDVTNRLTGNNQDSVVLIKRFCIEPTNKEKA